MLINGCGPHKFNYLRTDIIHEKLNSPPYNYLIHIGINYGEDWGTASYLNDSVLITARHVIEHSNLTKLQLYKNLFINGKDNDIHTELTINQDFTFKVFDNVAGIWINKDFAIIKLTRSGVAKTRIIIAVVLGWHPYSPVYPEALCCI